MEEETNVNICGFLVYAFSYWLRIGLRQCNIVDICFNSSQNCQQPWYYGLINAAFFIPSLFCPLILARIVDKTRRIRIFLITMLCLSIIGSILYSIPVSPVSFNWKIFKRIYYGCGSTYNFRSGEILHK